MAVFTLIGGFSAFLPLYLRENGFDELFVGLLFAIQSVVNGLTRIPIGILTDRIGQHGKFLGPAMIEASVVVFFLATVREATMLVGLMAVIGIGLGSSVLSATILVARGSSGRGQLRKSWI